jgi:hypothetical protein
MKNNYLISEIYGRISFWKNVDRIGPDIPGTHWMLHFKSTMSRLCKRKFKYFDDTAEFRPNAYAITCSKISIGSKVVIRPGTMLFADPRNGDNGSIIIEDDVLLGSGIHIYVANHRFDKPDIPHIQQGHYPPESVVLRKGCWIGANCIIQGLVVGPQEHLDIIDKTFQIRVR